MVNKIIKSEEDYQKTLARIDELMEATPNTPEGDELELLATLVELYEDVQYPIALPDPIEAINFRMEQSGLSQKDLVPFIGSKSKVSEIFSRKRTLSLSMIRSLHKGLGIPADILLHEINQELPEELPNIEWERFPIHEMMNRGWIRPQKNIKGNEEDIMRKYIEVAGGMNKFSQLSFRKSSSLVYKYRTNEYALMAWCLRVLELSKKNPLERTYKPGSFNLSDLAKLSYFDNGPLLAKEFLEKHGIQLFIVPHLKKTFLDGAVLILEKGKPVVALTLRYDRLDNFWFCLFHELAHLIKHLSIEATKIIIDELEWRPTGSDFEDIREKEADLLAQNALVPKKQWDTIDLETKNLAREVMRISEQLKIHPSIVAGRIRFEKNNYRLLNQFVGHKKVSRLFC